MRGSRMSRIPSPSRLKHNTASISARPGKATSHHLPVEMKRAPSATMMPHSGVGGLTPSPIKESPAALRIAQPRLTHICTTMPASPFGPSKPAPPPLHLPAPPSPLPHPPQHHPHL